MTTLRYRADSRIPYARALLALTVYARDHRGAFFDYGPLRLGALTDTGLFVSGEDLEPVRRLLDQVPGLYQVNE